VLEAPERLSRLVARCAIRDGRWIEHDNVRVRADNEAPLAFHLGTAALEDLSWHRCRPIGLTPTDACEQPQCLC
jgi:hypothetical protein